MTPTELHDTLANLLSLPGENEVVEFKEAKNGYDFTKLGRYFSALSNEANLKRRPHAWLVFGVDDKQRVVGSQYRPNRRDLDKLKGEIAAKTTNRITFIDIYEVSHPNGRVLLLQIPAAPRGIPIAFEGHYYGRDGEELGALNLEEMERIRLQSPQLDWSAEVVPNATLSQLDPEAIDKARQEFKKKNPHLVADIDAWDDVTFLNKAKLLYEGQMTRTALLLLGKPESTYYLSPYVAQVTWLLKKEDGTSLDYAHFGPPFLLEVDRILGKIRNLRYRYLPNGTLFPEELDMYDSYVIREALHNCLAHQDYRSGNRVVLIEHPDYLLFENSGSFLPKTVENVIERNAPAQFYRNRFLAEAMVNLGMIDTVGSGIVKMFVAQRDRFFPLPSYDFSEPDQVRLQIDGKILNKVYTQLLRDRPLSLSTVILLDKVQKGKSKLLTDEQIRLLRKEKLIEGKKPNIHLSVYVADQTGQEIEYIQNRGFDDDHYKKMILEYLKKFGKTPRKKLEKLIWDKLPGVLNDNQKKNKVTNLLASLRRDGKTVRLGYSDWELAG